MKVFVRIGLAVAFVLFVGLPPPSASAQVGMVPNWWMPNAGAPYTLEGRLYGGSVQASSFGTDFGTGVWGGGLALRVPSDQLRWQVDVQAEQTGNYSSIAGNRSYAAGGFHVDWVVRPGSEIGMFAGLQEAAPTFSGLPNTNYFLGAEARQFYGPLMVGLQGGYFSNANGAGTLIDTGFVEARVRWSIGDAFDIGALKYTNIGLNAGYGSGTSSATMTGAQTWYWGFSASQAFAGTPFSLTLEFQHFDNNVSGLGTVWSENLFMGGVKFAVPSSDTVQRWKEPTVPLPYILRTVTNF
ncbi:MAG TPA: hypothetical protein VK442_04410 [Xanthobacteraceae bacterium]|nr:hypothetical protein [Xanthobacteraceae bacterium]